MTNNAIIPYVSAEHRYKRSPAERERDLVIVARLYLRSYTQQEIADYIGNRRPYKLTQQQISHDLREIRGLWLNSALQDFDAHKSKELARLDELERQYWSGWKRSLEDQETNEKLSVEDVNVGVGGQVASGYRRHKSSTKRTTRDGSAAFLQGIERCIELRCRILGMFEPEKFAIVDWRSQAKKVGLENEAMVQFERMVEEATATLRAQGTLNGDDINE